MQPDRRTPRFKFPRHMRLSGRRQFAHVYAGKTRGSSGPLLIYGVPNDVGIQRLGLSVSRRVGTAVLRNTVKRRLREAFRQLQHDWPQANRGYDLVISVRPHRPLSVAEYDAHMRKAFHSMHQSWTKK